MALGKAKDASGKAESKLTGRKGAEDGGPGDGGGHNNPLAGSDPNRKPVEFHDEKVEVPVMPGDPGEVMGDGGFADADEGTASLPFEKVIVKYRADMEKAMDDEAYPEEYRRAVRDYFDSLK